MRKKIVWLPYDFDTALGINNEGSLVFGYELEDTDHIEGGADVYNGQQSVVWNNLRDAFGDELAAMYRELRSQGKLSYEKVEKMFEDHQGKWSEAIFNEDAYFKYILPLIDDGTGAYLEMLQGSKAEQRKWWLYNRFRYIDSKYNAGDALSDLIQLRSYAKSDVAITPYADIYPTVKFGSYLVSHRGKRGQATVCECPLTTLNDTETYIYSASQLASVGDLSGLKVGFADFSMATKLQSLKIGDADAGYTNPNLKTLTLGNNVLLKTIDVRNCPALVSTVDISGCSNIEEVYFEGTGVTGVTLPVGGVLRKLHLPSTITNLTIRNQSRITDLTVGGYTNISTLRIENSSVDSEAILRAVPAGTRVRLIGFAWEAENYAEIEALCDLLDTMRGLDEQGGNVDTAQVSGTIHTGTLTGAQIAAVRERYPYLTLTADHTSAVLTYKTFDGSSVIGSEDVLDGGNGTLTNSTARAQDAQYTYSPDGWATEPNGNKNADALKNVVADRTVYAAYSKTLRSYPVTFVRASEDGGGTLYIQASVPYGTTPTYSGDTPTTIKGNAEDYPFKGWRPELAPVDGTNLTYTAVFGGVSVTEIEDSIEQIFASIDDGTYKQKYQLGQYKPIDYNGTPLNFQIVGIDKDVLANGEGQAPLTFIAMNALQYNEKYKDDRNIEGGYKDAKIRAVCMSSYSNRLQEELWERIRTVIKTSKNGSGSMQTTEEDLWIPSAREIFGGQSGGAEQEGATYTEVFKDPSTRTRARMNRSESGYVYWLRSIDAGGSYVLIVSDEGVSGSRYPDNANVGAVIGFCLGKPEQETIKETWSEIGSTNDPSSVYSLGDTKKLSIDGVGDVLMEICGFDTDDLSDGTGKAKITWMCKQVILYGTPANSEKTSEGGWASSNIRAILANTILPHIQQDARGIIKEVTKLSGTYNSETSSMETVSTSDSIWIPSNKEMFGVDTFESGGAVYQYYVGDFKHRGKRIANKGPKPYWTRSTLTNLLAFKTIDMSGSSSGGVGNATNNGVVFGFCT